MAKVPFVTKEKVEEIASKYPTPFHLYDEKGIRENVKNSDGEAGTAGKKAPRPDHPKGRP